MPKFNSPALSRLIDLCDRHGLGVEQLNSRTARRGGFDESALTAWLISLSRGVDCERSARTPEIQQAATGALKELGPRLIRALEADETNERLLLPSLRSFVLRSTFA